MTKNKLLAIAILLLILGLFALYLIVDIAPHLITLLALIVTT